MALPVALQLYTVRDLYAKDPVKTLEQVAQIGYRYVEHAGWAGKTPAEIAATCQKLKLTGTGMHCGPNDLQDKLPALAAEAKTVGVKYLTLAWLPENLRTVEGYKQAAKQLSDGAKILADHGIKMCYHNHAFEFDKLPSGGMGMDILAGETSPDVGFELDVMWATWGLQDPVAWMKKLTGRLPLLHIKDTPGKPASGEPTKRFTEVGTGIVNLKGVLAAAPGCGVKYLIIEQDSDWVDGDAMKSAKVSFNNLTKMLA